MIFDGGSATLKLDTPAAFTGAIEDRRGWRRDRSCRDYGEFRELQRLDADDQRDQRSAAHLQQRQRRLAGDAVTVASDNNGGTLVYWSTAPAATTQYWITGASGDWSDAADWVSGVVPGSTDDAVIARE